MEVTGDGYSVNGGTSVEVTHLNGTQRTRVQMGQNTLTEQIRTSPVPKLKVGDETV